MGGSEIVQNTNGRDGIEESQTVLLSDVFEDILAYKDQQGISEKLFVTVKVDIQFHECKTFLGSADIFKLEQVFIPYLFIEWVFGTKMPNGDIEYHWACPLDILKAFTKLLVDNGYQAYDGKRRLDEKESHKWRFDNVIWKHQDSPPLL